MNKKSIFNIFCLTLMSISALFVANLSPYISVEASYQMPVTLVSGNKYKDSNGNFYLKAKARSTSYPMPSTGTKPANTSTEYFFKYEPIVWQVLSIENNVALVVSNKIIANMAFQPTYNSSNYTTANGGDGTTTTANDYTYSNIRYWLNGYAQTNQTSTATLNYGSSFYDTAFSTSEQNKILATSLTTTSDNTDKTTYVSGTFNQSSPTSADKIFLLSRNDLSKTYYSSNASRQKATTDYATSQGTYTNTIYNGYWWLRSPSSSDSFGAYIVRYGGGLGVDYVNDVISGVVPAMYLDTTDLIFYTDATCETQTTAEAKTYVQFGSYPQTVAEIENTEVPAAGVDVSMMGTIVSGIIFFGLFICVSSLGIKCMNKKREYKTKNTQLINENKI